MKELKQEVALRHFLHSLDKKVDASNKHQIGIALPSIENSKIDKLIRLMGSLKAAHLAKVNSILEYDDSPLNHLNEVNELKKLRELHQEVSSAYDILVDALDKQYLSVDEK